MNNNGLHVIADIYTREQCDQEATLKLIEAAIKISNMTVIERVVHKFNDNGAFTAMWLLAESHFTIHTYPEFNYISIDCYTCGDKSRPVSAVASILENLDPVDSNIKIVKRG